MENQEKLPQVPLHPNGKPMKSFDIEMRKGENGKIEKVVIIDNIEVDWSVDMNVLFDAARMGPHMLRAVQQDIARHYIQCISEVVGRKVSAQDIQKATDTGWI